MSWSEPAVHPPPEYSPSSGAAGFGILQALAVIAVFSVLAVMVQMRSSGSRKAQQGVIMSDLMDRMASEVGLALRDPFYCSQLLKLNGTLTATVGATAPVTIQYPGTAGAIQAGLNIQGLARLTSVSLAFLRTSSAAGGTTLLGEVRLSGTPIVDAFGGPVQRSVPIYLQGLAGTTIQACVSTSYFTPAAGVTSVGYTFEDNTCYLAAGSAAPTTRFDPFPVVPVAPASSAYCYSCQGAGC